MLTQLVYILDQKNFVFMRSAFCRGVDLSKHHDWPVKKAIVDLPIRLKGSSKRTSGNSLSPLGAQNNDLGTASQTLLRKVKLHRQRRLGYAYVLTNA